MEVPSHNLALDLVRVTEAAALAAARWLGRGDKNGGDQAAVDAMRLSFNSIDFEGEIVIGEGEKDEAPMLYNGEKVGTGNGPKMDVAVDPVEGTNLLAYGRPNAIAVIGVAPAGSMLDPGPSFYMRKLVVPAQAKTVVDIDAPVADNLRKVAKALNKDVDDLVVFVLDKPRHRELIAEIRKAGARIQLHTDGDVNGSLMAVDPTSEVDMMMGTGGTPEAVLSACAIRIMGGEFFAKFDPQLDNEKKALAEAGQDLSRIYTAADLVRSDDVFFAATGLSGGTFMPAVRFSGRGATTHSLVMRGKTGTVRRIIAEHSWDHLMQFSAVKYD
ncbi:MAG: class II fructose-bisphosphatase [Proteobacteria bacterium]|nr:class II fructose-bisphosphatase [Pseudomonadota bacterium]MBU1612557.1 class II fructose-bisphosphatase [Pseudomonadota bacterium]